MNTISEFITNQRTKEEKQFKVGTALFVLSVLILVIGASVLFTNPNLLTSFAENKVLNSIVNMTIMGLGILGAHLMGKPYRKTSHVVELNDVVVDKEHVMYQITGFNEDTQKVTLEATGTSSPKEVGLVSVLFEYSKV